jgi:hypothetical protein
LLRRFTPCQILKRRKGFAVVTSSVIQSYVKAQPFRPFRLHMASGKTFDIRHPEMIKVGRIDVMIFTPAPDEAEVFDRFETTSLTLVQCVSHLDAPVEA